MKKENLHIHINREYFENPKTDRTKEELENIKTQLATFILDNYDRLEENYVLDEIRNAYDSIESVIMDL